MRPHPRHAKGDLHESRSRFPHSHRATRRVHSARRGRYLPRLHRRLDLPAAFAVPGHRDPRRPRRSSDHGELGNDSKGHHQIEARRRGLRRAVANGGGGILINNSSPTIQNCLVQGNSAVDGVNYGQGGGAYVGGSKSAPLIRCTCFSGNSASHTGGGLTSTYLAHPYLSHVTFANNTADYGAGVAVEFDGLANVENSEFLGNTAYVDGGALHVLAPFGHVNMRRTLVLNNSAGGNGGGLWIPAGFTTVLNSIFDGNSAFNGGGAAAGFNGVLTVESSIFVNNTTTGSPGTTATLTSDVGPTTAINNYNLFFNNGGAATFNTSGNLGILTADPLFTNACYSLNVSSPALNAGFPELHFNNTDGTRNSMGMYGGASLP